MNYSTIVPVLSRNLERAGRERTAAVLRSAGISRVLIAIGCMCGGDQRKRQLEVLRENLDFMKGEGFEAGAWLWAYLYRGENAFTHITGADGTAAEDSCCPLDEGFWEEASGYMREIAAMKPALILFDDDLRFGQLETGLGCFCEKHIADISERLGEKLGREELVRRAFSGEANEYRSAWRASMGDSARGFARRMREAVDSVDDGIRLGQCACITTWDVDGVDSAELSRILAGKTKPFLRLIGAPYWAVNRGWGNRLQDCIELERMERSWCGEGIEIVSEGDVCPRPRWACPASYLECFDSALIASGGMDGIMKYMLDYSSSATYETGYIKRHVDNQPLYAELRSVFEGKAPAGVRIWEHREKFENASLSDIPDLNRVQDMLFSPAARIAAASGIPTVYDGCSAGIAFGENAKYLDDDAFRAGVLLDLRGAELLSAKGVDVGVSSFGEAIRLGVERFLVEDEYVDIEEAISKRLSLMPGASVDSCFNGSPDLPAVFTYVNSDGFRFAVLNLDLRDSHSSDEASYRNYCRQSQLIRLLEWLGGKPLPAYCAGEPDLYVLCKSSGGKTAAGVWNLSCDTASPIVTFPSNVKSARFIGCTGKLEGTRVTLSPIPPYTFAAVEASF